MEQNYKDLKNITCVQKGITMRKGVGINDSFSYLVMTKKQVQLLDRVRGKVFNELDMKDKKSLWAYWMIENKRRKKWKLQPI